MTNNTVAADDVAAEEMRRHRERTKDVLQAPGNVAIQIKDSVVDGAGGLFQSVKDKIGNSLKDLFDDSAKYDREAQDAYSKRAEIVSQFAREFQTKQLTPETMRKVEYLADSGALDMAGSEAPAISARLTKTFFGMVQEDPASYGLTVDATAGDKGVAKYANGTQDVTIYKPI